MVKVGVCGLGMMGQTHLDIYAKREDVQVVAVADLDPDRLSGSTKAEGNVEGQAQGGFSLADVQNKYADAAELIADGAVDLVDVCLPTPLHLRYAKQAFEAGKHVMVEKPLARTAAEAEALAQAGASAKGTGMPAMCMRFWPGWDWLKQAVEQERYGRVLGAHFRRLASFPGGPFYSDGQASGGALLDLHVHDTDFVQYLFGMPGAVFSRGYSKVTGQVDHVVTQYVYDAVPLVTAEGSWVMADGFGFMMQYMVNFEKATAIFDLASGDAPLKLVENGEPAKPVKLRKGMGYEYEIDYLLKCIAESKQPTIVTLADAAKSVRIVEAERQSIETGQVVSL